MADPKTKHGTVLVKGTPEYAAAIARTWAHANADANNETKESK